MNFLNTFASLFSNFGNLTWQMVVMWGIGALLIYLAIAKKMEPSLLLPMGFGAILVNLPLSGAITQGDTIGPISALFEAGMSNELFPLLLFIGIGAMIDFGPLLEKPWLLLFGAAAQFGIFLTLVLAGFFFDLKDAASIAVIGAADGPTAIFVANVLGSKYLGAIMVAAYSYMALVPIVQPPVIRLVTTKKERLIRMPYQKGKVSRLTRILFPILVTMIAGIAAPASASLVGFLMFGNLLRDALPFFLTFCACIRFQRGVPLLLRVARPCLKLGLGHILPHRARVVFLVCPLLHLPDFIVRNFVLKAAARADLTAGLAVLSRCSSGAIGVGCPRFLQKPATTVGAALRHKSLLQPLHELCIHKIQQPVKVHFFDHLRLAPSATDAELRVYLRRVHLRICAKADAADERLQAFFLNLLGQRSFSLAFFLFKRLACKEAVQKPRITLLNQPDGVQLLLHEPRQRIVLHHIFAERFLRFSHE